MNRARSALSSLFRWAIQQGLAEHNPVRDTERKPEEPRERVLSVAEMRAIWKATEGGLPAAYCGVVRLLLLTGQRRLEVADLRWREVDVDAALWTLPGERTKNKRAHLVPLSAPAVEILLAMPTRGEFVFGDGKGYRNWSQSKSRLDKRLPLLPAWTLHDCRRGFATALAEELDVPDRVIDAILNHLSGRGRITRTYIRAQHLAERAAALQEWAKFLLGE